MATILELRHPGLPLAWGDGGEVMRDVTRLVMLLPSQVVDLAVALDLFDSSREVSAAWKHPKFYWDEDRKAEAEVGAHLEEQACATKGRPLTMPERHAIREASRDLVRRAAWHKGRLPMEYVQRPMFMHARSFIYALDTIGCVLRVLSGIDAVPPGVSQQKLAFDEHFPELRDVRNSAHHVEDRVRGLGPSERKISLEPVDLPPLLSADAGVALLGETLVDRSFGCTLANGSYGRVEISLDSALRARNCVQGVLDAFTGSGSPVQWPL